MGRDDILSKEGGGLSKEGGGRKNEMGEEEKEEIAENDVGDKSYGKRQ